MSLGIILLNKTMCIKEIVAQIQTNEEQLNKECDCYIIHSKIDKEMVLRSINKMPFFIKKVYDVTESDDLINNMISNFKSIIEMHPNRIVVKTLKL